MKKIIAIALLFVALPVFSQSQPSPTSSTQSTQSTPPAPSSENQKASTSKETTTNIIDFCRTHTC